METSGRSGTFEGNLDISLSTASTSPTFFVYFVILSESVVCKRAVQPSVYDSRLPAEAEAGKVGGTVGVLVGGGVNDLGKAVDVEDDGVLDLSGELEDVSQLGKLFYSRSRRYQRGPWCT